MATIVMCSHPRNKWIVEEEKAWCEQCQQILTPKEIMKEKK